MQVYAWWETKLWAVSFFPFYFDVCSFNSIKCWNVWNLCRCTSLAIAGNELIREREHIFGFPLKMFNVHKVISFSWIWSDWKLNMYRNDLIMLRWVKNDSKNFRYDGTFRHQHFGSHKIALCRCCCCDRKWSSQNDKYESTTTVWCARFFAPFHLVSFFTAIQL